MALTAGVQLGRYRIIEQIGRGGMATVYKALQMGLDRYVALKVLPAQLAGDPQFGERFQREAVLIANLRHPNILTIFDYGADDGYTYLVSELVEGGTLAERIGRPMGEHNALALLTPIADALDYAHQRGIVHRDVKPSNILLASDGRPVLADFGIARMLDGSSGLTLAGKIIGTPAYMAPEQAQGASANSAVDRYALGVVAYQLLVGRAPFVAETTQAVLYAQIHQAPPAPRQINPGIAPATETALLRMLAKSPTERYPTARAFVEGLTPASPVTLLGAPVTAYPQTEEPSTSVAGLLPHMATPSRPLDHSPGTQPTPPQPGPSTTELRRQGQMKRTLLLGLGGGLLVALGVAGGQLFWLRPHSQDRGDPPDRLLAPPGGGPGSRQPAVTASPLSALPPVRVTTSATAASKAAPVSATPAAGADSERSGPPGGGPAVSPVALPPLAAWIRSGSLTGSWNLSQAGMATARVTDGNSMLLTPQTFHDIEIFAEVSTPNREASLAIRMDTDLNGYLGVYTPDGAPHLKGRIGGVAIVRLTGGIGTPLAVGRLPALVQVRDVVRLRLVARDEQLTLLLNGREVARATDATYREGRVGLRVFADADGPCDATFANVRVSVPQDRS